MCELKLGDLGLKLEFDGPDPANIVVRGPLQLRLRAVSHSEQSVLLSLLLLRDRPTGIQILPCPGLHRSSTK